MTDTRPARTSSTATVTRAYRDGELIAHGFPLAEVSDHLEDADCC